jgi:hypothetical protein
VIPQLPNFKRAATVQRMSVRYYSGDVDRIEQGASETLVSDRHVRDVDLAALQPGGKPGPSVFNDVHANTGMPTCVPWQEHGKSGLNQRRGRTDFDLAGVAGLQSPRSLAERVRISD